jgi:transposase
VEVRLTDAERSRMRSMVKRPRSRKQLYRAEALLALSEGRPVEEVARQCRVGVERVEGWIEAFSTRRMEFLADPDAGRPRQPDEGESEQDAG